MPTQLQEGTRKKLAGAVGSELPGDDGSALAFAAGVLWGIEEDARAIAQKAARGREQLARMLGLTGSSLAERSEEAAAALDARDAASAKAAPRKKKRA